MITSFQRRANDRRRYWHGYEAWLEQRLGENGGVAAFVRDEVERTGNAPVMWRADMAYRRRGRRYRPYAMKGEKR